MVFDFSFTVFEELLQTLISQDFMFSSLQTVSTTYSNRANVILRHDVEYRYDRALRFAEIEHSYGIKGSFYFRIFDRPGNDLIISKIASLGHEIGYHYDDLTECQGDYKKAIDRFTKNLNHLRQFGSISTITMEGAPLSRFDNRLLWIKNIKEKLDSVTSSRPVAVPNLPLNYMQLPQFDYRDFGIKSEPYFDLDFNSFFYLTDTGRRWDGWRTSVADKIPQQKDWQKKGLVFHSTSDIIEAAVQERLPRNMMITFHPQRWNDRAIPWMQELATQRVKNLAKRVLVLYYESKR